MVYVEVVFGVHIDWRTILGNQTDNVLLYGLDKFIWVNPLSPLEIRLPPTTIPFVFTRKPHVLP
jgi:hypothetical protein